MSENILNGTLRRGLKSGENKRIREITEGTGFFYPDEVDIAEELALIALDMKEKSEYKFLVYEKNGEIIGYSCYGYTACTRTSYDLYWIVVDSSYRGKGVGKILFRETEKIVKELGGRQLYIETSSRELYYPTRRFYINCGCEQVGAFKDFYDIGDDKIVYMINVSEDKNII
jgi:GNAT superfamily N-acetyltransferase